jgi:hypothetical protein
MAYLTGRGQINDMEKFINGLKKQSAQVARS